MNQPQLRESMNPRVISRLQTRLDLQQDPGAARTFLSPTIVPTTDADALLREYGTQSANTASITAGSSNNIDLYTVPRGRRWRCYFLDVVRSSGDNTIDRIQVSDNVAGTMIARFTAVSTFTLEFTQGIILDELQRLLVGVAGAGAGATVFTADMWVAEEDAF